MEVRIRCFGAVREIVGSSELVVDVSDGSTLHELMSRLCCRFPQLEPMTGSLLFAVNREYAAPDKGLAAGDEVVLIPPVSGGVDV
jgi:molybdopterin converting factor subunit 1